MSYRNKVFSGLIWTFSQQFGNLFIGFIVSLILARILLPEEFGLFAMVSVLVGLGEVLVDSGMTQSLIRSEHLDEKDYGTVFYFNLIISILLYILLFLIAPLISHFYNEESLTLITRVYCSVFVINAFSSVQQTKMTRQMDFKTQTLVAVPSKISGGILGVVLAYSGYGVWSLVWSHIVISLGYTVQMFYYSKWIPIYFINLERLKKHLFFGYKLTVAGILNKLFANIYLIVIGRLFTPSVLGFYTRAETMNHLAVSSISGALNKVTFPFFSKIKHDEVRLKKVYKELMKMVVFLIAPILILAGVLANPLFVFLFTEKWLPAVPFFQILCITGILQPIHAYNLNILKVKGRSDLYLKLAVIKKVIIVVGVITGIQFGIYGLLYAQVILSFLFLMINAYYTNIFIKYGSLEQFTDISLSIIIAGTSGLVVFYFDSSFFLGYDNFIRIIIGYSIGLFTYFIFSLKFQSSTLTKIKYLLGNQRGFK